MSRIGKKPVVVPKGVEVQLTPSSIQAKGPLGTLTFHLHPFVSIKKDGDAVHVALQIKTAEDQQHGRVVDRTTIASPAVPKSKDPQMKDKAAKAIWGMTRARVSALMTGVSVGFTKQLELQGVGYRVALKGNALDFSLGFSHPVSMTIPEGVKAKLEKDTKIILTSIDKEVLGEFAARLRALRPPGVYQGKGVRYVGEHVRQKAGKSAASTTKGA